MEIFHQVVNIKSSESVSIINLEKYILQAIEQSQIQTGVVTISSRHTTTAITINEFEERLLEDIKVWLARLAPAGHKYLHNDIHLRDCPPDEPENAHSHLMAMLIGGSESIPLENSRLAIGQYQSVMLLDLDGPRQRSVNIQVMGE